MTPVLSAVLVVVLVALVLWVIHWVRLDARERRIQADQRRRMADAMVDDHRLHQDRGRYLDDIFGRPE